jgi:arabinofuranosyltransferase
LTEEQERRIRRQWLAWRFVLQYGIGVVVLVFYVTAGLHFRYTPDDTYISMQVGKNVARGDGLSFNAGTPGNTTRGPLWILLIAGGAKLDLDPYVVAKTLDLAFASLSVIAVLAFAFIMIRDRIYALIAAWIFSFDAWFLLSSGTGSGTSLAVLLVLLTIWYAYKKEYITSSFVLGLLTLVRPEGSILLVPMLLDAALNARGRAAVVRAIAGSLLMYGVIVGSWLLFSYVSFGTLLPDTMFAGTTFQLSGAGRWHAILSCFEILGTTQLTLVIALVVGVIVTTRRAAWRIFREEGFPLLWMLMLPALFLFIRVEVLSSYLLLILPVVVVYGVWGVKQLEVASIVTPQRGFAILLAVAGLSLAQNQFVYQTRILPGMKNSELGVEECLKPIAYWLRSNSQEGSTVLSPDIGVIGYVSERRMIDVSGVVSPEMKLVFAGVGYDEGMMQKRYERVVHPDYIVDRSPTPERLSSESVRPVMTRTYPGPGLLNSGMVYYTLYRVTK